jgi:hypothetical protein
MNRFVLSAAGCAPPPPSSHAPTPPSAVDHASLHVAAAKGGNSMNAGNGNGAGLLKAVHASVARYHSLQQAEQAGYVSTVHCVQAPGSAPWACTT